MMMFFLVAGLSACGQGGISERDLKRQQQQSASNAKREELKRVEGVYRGTLVGNSDYRQTVILTLRVEDVPEEQEGSVDPILVPKLVGFLRFYFGAEDSHEYMDAGITSADFNVARRQVVLVIAHDHFKELLMRLDHVEGSLIGNWVASSVGAQGSAELRK